MMAVLRTIGFAVAALFTVAVVCSCGVPVLGPDPGTGGGVK